jgi:hypothetical protein
LIEVTIAFRRRNERLTKRGDRQCEEATDGNGLQTLVLTTNTRRKNSLEGWNLHQDLTRKAATIRSATLYAQELRRASLGKANLIFSLAFR